MLRFLRIQRTKEGKRDGAVLLIDAAILVMVVVLASSIFGIFGHLSMALHHGFLVGMNSLLFLMLALGLWRMPREERPKASLWFLFFVLLTVPYVWGFPLLAQSISLAVALALLAFLVGRRIKLPALTD